MRTTGVVVVLFIVLCNSDSEVRAAHQTKEAVVRTNDMVLNPINSRRSPVVGPVKHFVFVWILVGLSSKSSHDMTG